MADKLVEDGWKDLGYQYVNIDDCWSAKMRDDDGKIQPDPERFPNGIKALADYVHSKGLKLGIYGDLGITTCSGFPGTTLEKVDTDAKTFAEWEIDMLKFDGCNSNSTEKAIGYPKMSHALNATGRPIIYSCSWPAYEFGLPPKLIVGDFGLNYDQSKSQLALWAMLAAPFFMSNDLRTISKDAKTLLQNRLLIHIDQDHLGLQGERIEKDWDFQVWKRNLTDGQFAVAYLCTATDGNIRTFKLSLPALFIVDSILEDIGAYILLDVLNSLESEYSVEAQSVPSTITWRRELPEVMLNDLPEETKNMYKSKEENQILVLLSPNHFLKMVWLHKQARNISTTLMPQKRVTFMKLFREKGLYSPVKRPKNSEKESIEDSESWVSRELGLTCADLDEVQVALQLQTHTTVWFLENWQQFADHIATLTKAIARSPFKKQTEKVTFSFCPDGTWSTGVKVDKDGKGLLKLWKKQLQQLNRITQPVAMAIAQAYPTPKLLLRAYRQCSTEWEKQNLLSEVKVYAAGKRVDRRVGPDISRRLYIFMTSENSDIVLDKSG
ncbi:hypothetical protein chiPu_0004474 [Chiloscyllium punctatum]|uniref:Alpha-galactosidase n=1 Tax=Chiloscyllium punctatum TaxID=137246 RepID=A0A401S6S8_CHIPU|nr:hypothetical protein [Chiloscyllium punctatum]